MSLPGDDDDVKASILGKRSKKNPIDLTADDEFAHDLQLKEVIILSSRRNPRSRTGSRRNPIVIDDSTESIEIGETSQLLCEICAESKDRDLIFPLKKCSHVYCKECISRHVSIKIENRTIADAAALGCPGVGCRGDLDLAACRGVLPKDLVSKWDEVLCESTIAAAQKVYCPYEKCSELMVHDGCGGEIREAECPSCRRLFCANCKVPWHAGIDCEGFKRLKKDERESGDIMLHNLAKNMRWKRCPNCNFFVEKRDGCLHISCRCGYHFCYACGQTWSLIHSGCPGAY